jgi:hypothetical protein
MEEIYNYIHNTIAMLMKSLITNNSEEKSLVKEDIFFKLNLINTHLFYMNIPYAEIRFKLQELYFHYIDFDIDFLGISPFIKQLASFIEELKNRELLVAVSCLSNSYKNCSIDEALLEIGKRRATVIKKIGSCEKRWQALKVLELELFPIDIELAGIKRIDVKTYLLLYLKQIFDSLNSDKASDTSNVLPMIREIIKVIEDKNSCYLDIRKSLGQLQEYCLKNNAVIDVIERLTPIYLFLDKEEEQAAKKFCIKRLHMTEINSDDIAGVITGLQMEIQTSHQQGDIPSAIPLEVALCGFKAREDDFKTNVLHHPIV